MCDDDSLYLDLADSSLLDATITFYLLLYRRNELDGGGGHSILCGPIYSIDGVCMAFCFENHRCFRSTWLFKVAGILHIASCQSTRRHCWRNGDVIGTVTRELGRNPELFFTVTIILVKVFLKGFR